MKKLIAIITVLVLCLSLAPMAMAAEDTYTVAGETGLCGSDWKANDTNNQMTKSGSIYTITYQDVPAGTYHFKVVKNSDWSTCWPSSNYVLTTTKVCDVTINFDPSSNSITVLLDGVGLGDSYIVAGDSGLCNGIAWGETNNTNQMTLKNGVYTITFQDVMPGDYGFKIVKNGSWATSWPPSNYTISVGAVSDVTITFNPSDNSITPTITPTGQQVEIVNKYVVAGDEALTGESWSPDSENNQMTEENGVYKITFQDVAAGSYGFKVVKNGSWTSSWPGENYSITLEADSDVTITFDPSDNSIDVNIAVNGVTVPDTYVVAGDEALTGENWIADSTNNKMTEENGVYKLTFHDVAAGAYEFKVVKNGSWTSCWPSDNYAITLNETSDVTVTFDPSDNSIDVDVVVNGVVVPDIYVVAGSAGLCGSEWNPTDTANQMTETQEGVYSITYANVAAGEYELKVVLNGSNWIGGANGNNVKVVVSESCDVTVTYSADGIAVTGDHVTVHLTGNPTTGDGTDLIPLCTILVLSCALLVALTVNKKKFF